MPEPHDAVGSAGSPEAGSPCPLMWAGPPITGWLTSGRFWGHADQPDLAGTGSRARRVGSLLAPGSPQTAVSDTNSSSPRQVYTGLPSWRLAREGEERSAENRRPFAPHRFLPDSMTISPGVRSHGYRGYRLNNRVHLPNHFHCTVQARRPPGGPLLVSLWVCFCPRPGISWRADSLGSSPGLSFQGASDHWFVCPSL